MFEIFFDGNRSEIFKTQKHETFFEPQWISQTNKYMRRISSNALDFTNTENMKNACENFDFDIFRPRWRKGRNSKPAGQI